MKKTLAALIVGAFAASAANATVIYDNEGTKVEFDGSIRLIAEKTNFDGGKKSDGSFKHTHSALRNAGTRFGLTVNHDLGDGYYALGRFEARFDGKDEKVDSVTTKKDKQGNREYVVNKNKDVNTDAFGKLVTKRVYVGFGHKDFGEIRFGRQLTLADDLSTANDYKYGILNKEDYIPTEGNSVIRYDYKGIEGLDVGASYQFAETRTDNYEVKDGTLENAAQVGATYEANNVIAKFGYGRTNIKTDTSKKHHIDGFLASLGYDFGGFIASVDGGYAKEKENGFNTKRFYVSPGFQFQVTDASSIYGNYKYEQEKDHEGAKEKTHGFLLGVDYKLHKHVVTYLEGKYQVTKEYDKNGHFVDNTTARDKAIGVGVRVFW